MLAIMHGHVVIHIHDSSVHVHSDSIPGENLWLLDDTKMLTDTYGKSERFKPRPPCMNTKNGCAVQLHPLA